MPGRIQRERKTAVPVSKLKQEALANLQRTAGLLARSMRQAFRERELTAPQYNVLSLLRDAGKDGLRCSEIAARMTHADPDVTRILTRLQNSRLIEQRQDLKDRRAIYTRISSAGLRKLRALDRLVQRTTEGLFVDMKPEKIRLLIKLLQQARAGLDG